MLEVTIDFNQETIPQLIARLTKSGLCRDDFCLILNEKQFENFKLMYRIMRVNYDKLPTSQEYLTANQTGIIFGMQYKVKDN